ncbi:three-helix bundle dimerization domain-containing protein [Sinomonas sp.]|jgi:cation transport regulator ChaC|uniref:three-helix bundle dimerization domain-containing protein n=1 Tax=Sinomonas sp. TaxID=1914986 RepID=UPI002FE0BF0B
MEQQSEAQALAQIHARLAARFPDADEEAVASAISSAHGEMVGPVRDYVPVLVEHLARKRLARAGHAGTGTPPRAAAGALGPPPTT